MKVTRIAYSKNINAGKYVQLQEQARCLGKIRSLIWQKFGSVSGAKLSDRTIRNGWLKDGTAITFGVLANGWKETLRDAIDDIKANREAAKVKVRRAIHTRTSDPVERKRLYTLLKTDTWASDSYLSRKMRQYWKRGHNHTNNQIVVRSDDYSTFTTIESGNAWIAIPGLECYSRIAIPLSTTVAPSGTLRLILRNNQVEVHYQIDSSTLPNRPCGERTIGVDKGYTEVLTDSDGIHHGPELGKILSKQSDKIKVRNQARSKLRKIAEKAIDRGNHSKSNRIFQNNLGTVKRNRQDRKVKEYIRSITYIAVHKVIDKAKTVVAEDLTKQFAGHNYGRNMNRRLSAWTKGITAQALKDISERRSSTLVHVNAAYTSQIDHRTGFFGTRNGDIFHCANGEVLDADMNAAINVLQRLGDPDIALLTPFKRVKQILKERIDRQRIRLPILDSSTVKCTESELFITTYA